jgi:hypothetical protein
MISYLHKILTGVSPDMNDQLQVAADRIEKFKAHAEAAKATQDKSLIEKAVFDARKEWIVIQHCFKGIETEAELIFNDVFRHLGLDIVNNYEKKMEPVVPAPQQTQEQVVVPQYLGAHLGDTQPLATQETAPVQPTQEATQQTAP